MKKTKQIHLILLITMMVFFASCNMPSGQETATQSPEQLQTFVAQTVTADAQNQQTQNPTATEDPSTTQEGTPEFTATASATNTPFPTDQPTFTNTPVPCNLARFVADVNIPDGTDFNPGDGFVKTWRLQNVGSCDWTSGYDIVFSSGDAMGAPSAVQLTTSVVPTGGTVDVSVSLVAPDDPGTYRGNWKLRDAADQVFGIQSAGEFWVEIDVLAPTDTPEPTETPTDTPEPNKPDLIISNMEFSDPPVQDIPVDIEISVYNQGNAASGEFIVVWYSTHGVTSPTCSWVLNSLVANGGKVLSCTHTYPSWYGNIDIIAIADVNDDIDESNESNNQLTKNTSVSKP